MEKAAVRLVYKILSIEEKNVKNLGEEEELSVRQDVNLVIKRMLYIVKHCDRSVKMRTILDLSISQIEKKHGKLSKETKIIFKTINSKNYEQTRSRRGKQRPVADLQRIDFSEKENN